MLRALASVFYRGNGQLNYSREHVRGLLGHPLRVPLVSGPEVGNEVEYTFLFKVGNKVEYTFLSFVCSALSRIP